ncbi:MAG: fused MFS/spermidine synthase [Desulfovibrionales bacterium]
MRRLLVYFITFVTGGVFLGLEIVASRVLAPYFGNSVFVWGSLISVFLLALSLGYWLGGIAADQWPSFRVLSLIVLSAALLVLILPVLHLPLSQVIVDLGLEFRISVLLACTLFFLLPSVLMGMVSPFIIKLNATELAVIGQTAGNIYAISTAGSIAGALGVSFFLIPAIGTRAILFLSGMILAGVGLLCLAGHWSFLVSQRRSAAISPVQGRRVLPFQGGGTARDRGQG